MVRQANVVWLATCWSLCSPATADAAAAKMLAIECLFQALSEGRTLRPLCTTRQAGSGLPLPPSGNATLAFGPCL